MYYSSVTVYGIIRRGTLGDCPHRNTAETENNKHHITAKNVANTDIAILNFVLQLISSKSPYY